MRLSDLSSLHDAAAHVARDPLAHMRWSKWQRAFLEDTSPNRLARTANQIGKTTAAVADILDVARGTGRFRPVLHRPPVNLLVLSESIEQLGRGGALMEKLWELAPRHELDPGNYLVRGRGITGKPPLLRFLHGPGAGSVINFGTYRQDPATFAGSTIHGVWCDEPMPQATYGELRPRLLKLGGTFTVTMTPVPDMRPQDFMRDLVESGHFAEHHATLTVSNCWPVGAPRPFMSADMIARFAAELPEVERRMRIDADWEALVTGRWLTAFSEASVRPFSLGDLPSDAVVVVGIDHGLQAGKQAAVGIAVSGADTPTPRVWVFGEANSDGTTTPEHDALDILEMLKRNGLEYRHVDDWIGDRSTGDGLLLKSKTNKDLQYHLHRAAGIRNTDPAARRIVTPRKWAGSVSHGLKVMNAIMGRGVAEGSPHFVVHPSCEHLLKAIRTFAGNSRDPGKDILDACRYAVERATNGGKRVLFRGRY